MVIRSPKPPPDVLIVQYLHLEGEVLLEVLDDHDEEGELDAQGLTGLGWAGNEGRGHIGTHYFENTALNVRVCYTLDVAVSYGLIPNLQGLATNTVQD